MQTFRPLTLIVLGALTAAVVGTPARALTPDPALPDPPVIAMPIPEIQLPKLPPLPSVDLPQIPVPQFPPIPLLSRDLQPVANPLTGRKFDVVVLAGHLYVRMWVQKTGILPAGSSIARVVFRRSVPVPLLPLNRAVYVGVPAMIFPSTIARLVPVPAGYSPYLGYMETVDIFNAVSESNELNNTTIVFPGN